MIDNIRLLWLFYIDYSIYMMNLILIFLMLLMQISRSQIDFINLRLLSEYLSTFQQGRPVLGQLKIGPTSQEPGDNHRCNIFSPFNIFNTAIYLIYSVYSIYWRWAPQDKNLLTSNQFFQNIDEFELALILSLLSLQ